ncbi:molybdopterin-binding protein [Desulfovibrio gilichinskyi]|uniref:Molybdopterin molybdenumtransferase n=1 Tax=Desulfovibrio gilichinskyi TaxID=1519643 RepID=A0A1X7E6C4_9BACT|nr:molybdopterin-binding protein [Desulfovibrio gilichinskyi]SMF28205.1 molybdenum cofactor cytidylyltransferase [Desulfovibrio gilichinskyi]
MMKTVPVQDSIGSVLCHDMTRIVPGEFKGPAFRKGHIIKQEDIPVLLEIGKEHVYILTLEEGQLHENDAARRIANAAAGPGITLSAISEGRINMKAAPGLLSINVEALERINSIDEVVLATMHNGIQITEPRDVAGTRVVPLVIDESKIIEVEKICRESGPIVSVKPFKHLNVALITTGSEVYTGRIQDKFGPVIRKKFNALNSEVISQTLVSDDPEMTRAAIMKCIDDGAQMVVLTGGMSVDPDDQTPASIRSTGAEVVTYGTPSFPGVMFMLAYLNGVPIIGLPGCVMYYRASIFDLIVPRIVAGERPTRKEIAALGHGGFCAGCETCRYPLCSFGK